jgi:glycosyltransferase involved in cell wall biosynthesis
MEFKVSVIIPIFNVAEYVNHSVESAVNLPEVGEVLLIEDGSIDNSLEVCKRLESKYEKVKVFQHQGGINKGPSASRNLGIQKAGFPLIAFLDADDWYLPHRFKKDMLNFEKHIEIDAAYSCTILEENLGFIEKRYGVKSAPGPLWENPKTPMEFYQKIIQAKAVLFNTNSITLKKEFLTKEKCFDERLALHQDSELWNRLLRRGVFLVAEWENPVAVIRRHDKNRITSRSLHSHLKMMAVQIDNIGLSNLYDFEVQVLFTRILKEKSKKYKNHWIRRGYFYGMFVLNWFRKKDFLEKTRKAYAFD